jgi:valyl-tRNA synthetase
VWIEEVKKEIKDEGIGSKKRIESFQTFIHFKKDLMIMHPFVPFVTESVWQE